MTGQNATDDSTKKKTTVIIVTKTDRKETIAFGDLIANNTTAQLTGDQ